MKILGEIQFPGDKSLSHRAIMLASIAKGESCIYNTPKSRDVLATINCLRLCGADIQRDEDEIKVTGSMIKNPGNKLNCDNSGTTARLLLGLLSGQNILAHLYGDQSLSKRPMDRVIDPLKEIGVDITSNNKHLPIQIKNIRLDKIGYNIPFPSAQVKSCMIFAALGCNEASNIQGRIDTRDHLERMLCYLSSDGIAYTDDMIKIYPDKININCFKMDLPGDVSSASFFIALACLMRGSKLIINNILLNKHRLGFIETLKLMGANIIISKKRVKFNESVGTVTVVGDRELSPCNILSSKIPSMIDELPILSLVCAHVNGISTIEGVGELRYKESNRYKATIKILSNMGVDVGKHKNDGFIIKGKNKLYNTNNLDCENDHRLAMMISVAQIVSKNNVDYHECINVSFPGFKSAINKVLI